VYFINSLDNHENAGHQVLNNPFKDYSAQKIYCVSDVGSSASILELFGRFWGPLARFQFLQIVIIMLIFLTKYFRESSISE
jgi:hypothetical protein